MIRQPTDNLDLKQLALLNTVQQHRLNKLQKTLTTQLAEREQLNEFLRLVDADNQQIREQRQQWRQQWQDWLEQRGPLWQGSSYNNRHQQLTALEKLLAEHRAEIIRQQDELQQRIAHQNQLIVRQQKKIDAIQKAIEQIRQSQHQIAERRNAGMTDELVLAQWFAHPQAVRQTEA